MHGAGDSVHRHRLESVDTGIAGEIDPLDGDERLEHPVRQRRDGVVAQGKEPGPATIDRGKTTDREFGL